MLGIAFTVVGISETPLRVQTASANTSPPGAMSAAEAYQIFRVLKEIPADQLVPAMQFITYSLGVECSYCHVEGALEKDDKKPKQTARKMMQMMAAITGTTLIRSKRSPATPAIVAAPHPVATPIIAEGGPRPAFESVLGEDTSLTDAPQPSR